MIANKKEFGGGLIMLVAFFVVLFLMFQPMFDGHNAMQYLDNLYNSISKGSVDYAPSLEGDAAKLNGANVALQLNYGSEAEAAQSAALLTASGSKVEVSGTGLTVSGSLGAILTASLKDSNLMYHNEGDKLSGKYDLEARRVVFNWWTTLGQVDRALKKQKKFEAAKTTLTIRKKAVEAAYNYYGVAPVHIMDKAGMVAFSLVFYVVYTLWYGFAIMFLFEGWGLRLSH
jgi:hypothetical protein